MYLRYFALQDHPFAITPDPAFLYLSAHHREALGHLLYGTGEHGGFVQLTGEVGTGKTTLIRALLEQGKDVTDVDVALCLNPQLTVIDLLAAICDELHIKYSSRGQLSLKTLIDRLNEHLLKTHAQGRRTVLIIDEAQNLSPEVLEQVRLLTNLETGKHKLLRIILVGQPELEAILARPDMRQLAQRITARFHLHGLDRAATDKYISHRMRVAGGASEVFSTRARAAVYRYSGGIPRLINTICERALMGAYAGETRRVTANMVQRAAREALPSTLLRPQAQSSQQLVPVAVLLGATLLAFCLHFYVLDAVPLPSGGSDLSPSPAQQVADAGQAQNDADESSVSDYATQTAAQDGSSEAESVVELPESDASMSQLLRLWGVFGAKVDISCDSLNIGDLHCLEERGSLADLARFNRPALLVLKQGDQQQTVLLSKLDAGKATLITGDGIREWPPSQLARVWNGEYQMLWRLQSSTRRIGTGSVGDSVIWLRRSLALAEGNNPESQVGPPSSIFDDALGAQLRRFQITQGLEPDGLVGARTMIALNNQHPAPGTPLLDSSADDDSALPADQVVAQAPAGCSEISDLPPARELLQVQFDVNSMDLRQADSDRAQQLAATISDTSTAIFIAGMSYNENLETARLRDLAMGRAQAVANRLQAGGIAATRIRCLPITGARAPTPGMDRAAIVYIAAETKR